jgi:uncharacterized protein
VEFILSLTVQSLEQVLLTLQHNWLYLVISVLVATLLKLYVDADKISGFLNRYRGASIFAATAAAVATPLCSCGTTAVVLGMMATRMTWAPIIAFMVSSPLTSPEEVVYSAGLFGWPFALAFLLSSIVLGLAGGWIAAMLETRGWLANQTRFTEPAPAPCACSTAAPIAATPKRVFSMDIELINASDLQPACCGVANTPVRASSCGCGQAKGLPADTEPTSGCDCGSSALTPSNAQIAPQKAPVTLAMFLRELYGSGKQLFVMFLGFAFVGYFLNGLIPAQWVAAIFGSGNIYNVPLAATLGLPLYINSEASLPLIRALLDNGMSQGAALAFIISGAGTSIGAITGALTIARWRVVAVVVGVLWAGAIVSGMAFNLALSLKLF